jgi:hypothetical protein
MMAHQRNEVQVHAFLTQEERVVSGQLHVPTALTHGKDAAVRIL